MVGEINCVRVARGFPSVVVSVVVGATLVSVEIDEEKAVFEGIGVDETSGFTGRMVFAGTSAIVFTFVGEKGVGECKPTGSFNPSEPDATSDFVGEEYTLEDCVPDNTRVWAVAVRSRGLE
jgi:hypothetical protein